jgi:predicted 2-oxoglutarate/Fe(II)-dependent dioxygenase YbiX/peroxiredoxin
MSETPFRLGRGDHAPAFRAPALSGSPTYAFDTVGGRHVLMLFFGSTDFPPVAEALALVQRERDLFDDYQACFFGVTINPADVRRGRIEQQLPGIRYFLDYDRAVSGRYGAIADKQYLPHWLLLDPTLRVIESFAIGDGAEAMAMLRGCLESPFPEGAWAPVLRVPDVLDPEMCRHLIQLYEENGGEASGFMRDVEGKTRMIFDPEHKTRRDFIIADERLTRTLAASLARRLNPALEKAFQFRATRIERYLVACYEAGAGHFRPHRDNTTKGTAHRQFAVTINLNADDYDGGDLRFPEYGPRLYRAPTGGAVVFSCALLHEAVPVTRGRRFAFLPFLYNEEGAKLREANNPHLGPELNEYRMSG